MSVHTLFQNVSMTIEQATAEQVSANTSWIAPFTLWDRFAYVIYAHTIGTTIDAVVQQASDSSGTGAKSVTDVSSNTLSVVQLEAADDGALAVLELGPGALDDKNGFEYIRLAVTADGTCTWGVFGIRFKGRYPGNFTYDTAFLYDHSRVLYSKGVDRALLDS